jgi:hypothetical protein
MDFSMDLLLLVVVGFFAGIINTLAGGGSLLTLPMLIFMGLPSGVANGTNRIAIILQNVMGTAGFRSRGVKTFPFSNYLGVSALFGAIIGAQIAVDINDTLFNRILAITMIIIVLLIIFKPKLKFEDLAERTTGKYLWISCIVFFFIGIYGGFLNAGVGFIMILFFNYVNRISLVKANATKVAVVVIYMCGALFMFAMNDMINWQYGLILSIGNMTGAWFGSRYAVKKGDGFVKKFLVVAIIGMAIKLWFF